MKKSTKIILGVVSAVVVVGAGVATAVSVANQPDPVDQLITTEVDVRTISTTVAASGEVQAADQVGVNFASAGDIVSIAVEEGDEVSAGDTLATLDPTALETALATAKNTVAGARDGISAANLAEATAQSAINTADQALAAAKQAIATAKDLDSNRSEAVATANRQLAAAEAQRDTAEFQQARVPLQKAAASSALAAAQAGLEQAEANLEKATLRAPMSGTVLMVGAEEGDSITTAGADVFVIADLGAFEVTANFAESDVISIEEGQSVQVDFDAIPGESREGTVTKVSLMGQVDPTGGSLTTYPVTVAISDAPELLRVGMTAQINIITAENVDVVAAPVAALNVRGEDVVVNVLQPDQTVQEVVVETGTQGSNFVEITSGLEGGETVIIGDVGDFPVVASDDEFNPATGPPPGVEDQQRQEEQFNE